ncbi:Uncharacterised protein [uncultured archaeon]|nr:Uncharacterised protein [uncultured archaeon]
MTFREKILATANGECSKNGVKLYFGTGKWIEESAGLYCRGFFNPFLPKLAVATGNKEWELILAHELNHLRQWSEKSWAWKNYERSEGISSDVIVHEKKVPYNKFLQSVWTTLKLEKDCEDRTSKMLKSMGYSQRKLGEYIQKANAYVLYYLEFLKTRNWCESSNVPFENPKVWKYFPKNFDYDIPKTFNRLEHLYAKNS